MTQTSNMPSLPVAAVSCAVEREGRLLMVRRRNPPNAGRLSLPGGKVEPGESLAAAAARELLEETGVRARASRPLTAFDIIEHDDDGRLRFHYVVVVMQMSWDAGEPTAGDDATHACWMDLQALTAAEGDVCDTAAEVGMQLLGARNHR
ncbi:MAG: NUDIX hydrolase [Halomonas sp.]|uniref:NUDIX hydrolase n=1 Tax=Halomonas sp. TaxID=1486246 RepID=UPI0019DC4C74|nr:NUDIX hydrolase [Halomonas sp.]MBE0487782.1 NUDIX hydrolase [Halomonas sp.]